jgi:hydrogenase expression/formation protein HypC
MCIGLPMRVIECEGGCAVCEGQGERRTIDMMLVGAQAPGTWVLVFLDAAREVVTPEHAARVGQALKALELAMTGDADIDHLFPDLAGREPELPAHLKEQFAKTTSRGDPS